MMSSRISMVFWAMCRASGHRSRLIHLTSSARIRREMPTMCCFAPAYLSLLTVKYLHLSEHLRICVGLVLVNFLELDGRPFEIVIRCKDRRKLGHLLQTPGYSGPARTV